MTVDDGSDAAHPRFASLYCEYTMRGRPYLPKNTSESLEKTMNWLTTVAGPDSGEPPHAIKMNQLDDARINIDVQPIYQSQALSSTQPATDVERASTTIGAPHLSRVRFRSIAFGSRAREKLLTVCIPYIATSG